MGFNVPVLTEEELADVFAVFQAADRSSQSPMSISLMAERMFAALDAGRTRSSAPESSGACGACGRV